MAGKSSERLGGMWTTAGIVGFGCATFVFWASTFGARFVIVEWGSLLAWILAFAVVAARLLVWAGASIKVAVSLALIASVMTATFFRPEARAQQLIENVHAYLQYAYEWKYLGSTNRDGDTFRFLDSASPLTRTFSPGAKETLVLGIANANKSPVDTALMVLEVPEDVVVEMVPGGCWTRQLPRTFHCEVKRLDNERGGHSGQPLLLTFPDFGVYDFAYRLKAEGLEWHNDKFTILMNRP